MNRLTIVLLAMTVVAGCTLGQRPSTSERGSDGGQTSVAAKRITAAILAAPPLVINAFTFPSPGTEAVEVLVNSGLSIIDDRGLLTPRLAETVPSLDNGLWKLFPDGRMETTWQLRPNAQWHDGAPFTSSDVAFTFQVGNDLPKLRHPGYKSVEAIDTPDPLTVKVTWAETYIFADGLFGPRPDTGQYITPLPEHLLAQTYAADKTKLLDLSYWGSDFVGTGPFRVGEFDPANHLVLIANDRYVLGAPRLGEIEVKFIPDASTLFANVLAGTVDVTLGRGLSVGAALRVRDQWPQGQMGTQMIQVLLIYPQFIDSNPQMITDLRFRRALLYAIDRQQLVDAFVPGLSQVADSFVSPANPGYTEIESATVRYAYDPRRAAQMLADLGYTRGSDGGLRDAANQTLSVELRVQPTADQLQAMLAVADYWRAVGVGVDAVSIPPQRVTDRDYYSTFPGFLLSGTQSRVDGGLLNFHSSQTYIPGVFTGGGNAPRYINPEFDDLLDRFLRTVPVQPRIEVLRAIIRHVSDQLNLMTLYYNVESMLVSNRLRNARPRAPGSSVAWNAAQWDWDVD